MSLALFSSSMATVSSEDTPRVQYTANGITTNFPITFAYASISDVHVYFISNSTGLATAWTKDAAGPTGYTVSAGSIIANTAPSNGYLVAVCETPVTQLVDVKPNRALPADTLEGVFDKLTLIGRDLKGKSSRSLVYGPTYTGSIPYAEDLADEIQRDSVDAAVAAVSSLSFSTSLHIDNIEALRLYAGGETTSIYLDCHTSIGDGGHGAFRWDAASTAADDNGVTIAVTGVATGRWIRQLNGFVTPEMFGAVGDGTTEDTAALQSSLDTASAMAVKSVWGLGGKHYITYVLNFTSNTLLEMTPGTIVEARTGFEDGVRMIRIIDAENIVIKGNGSTFKMKKAEYTTGEHRHCFNIQGSTDIYISKVSANDSGGDGFMIARSQTGGKLWCENIVLEDVICDNNRRQGISVTSVKGLKIIRPIITNTNGTAPQAGIDLEPDHDYEFLEGIEIIDPITENNAGHGIQIYASHLSNVDKNITIDIINHRDTGSNTGFSCRLLNTGSNTVTGRVTLKNPIYADNNLPGIMLGGWDKNGPKITLDHPTVINPNSLNYVYDQYKCGIMIHSDVGVSAETGNVLIISPTVIDTRATKLISYGMFIKPLSAVPIEDIMIEGDIELQGTVSPIRVMAGFNLKDDYSRLVNHVTSNISHNEYTSSYSLFTNEGATGMVTITGTVVKSPWPDIIMEVRTSKILRFDPDSASIIQPMASAPGKYIQSSVVGSRIRLRRISLTAWQVIEQVGTWTAEP